MKKQDFAPSPSFQAASRASRSPPQGGSVASTMNATCGPKCCGSSGNCSPVGCLEKMLLASSVWGSTKRSLTWSRQAEAQRIAADMKRLAAPNSPDKNHFMVEVSPYFTKLASSRDTDQLLAMLPYKSLHLSSVKDRFGIYALVDKNENRDKGICKPRASVRKQLSETKQVAIPKKAAARNKQHEMEV